MPLALRMNVPSYSQQTVATCYDVALPSTSPINNGMWCNRTWTHKIITFYVSSDAPGSKRGSFARNVQQMTIDSHLKWLRVVRLEREPVKLFAKIPKQRWWLTYRWFEAEQALISTPFRHCNHIIDVRRNSVCWFFFYFSTFIFMSVSCVRCVRCNAAQCTRWKMFNK